MASAEDVAMEVRHGFAAVLAVIDDQTVAGFIQPKLGGDFGGFEQQMAENFFIVRLRFGDAWNGFLRDDDEVGGRLRIYVAEGEDGFVFKDNRGRNFSRGDFFKQSFAHDESLDRNCANFHELFSLRVDCYVLLFCRIFSALQIRHL